MKKLFKVGVFAALVTLFSSTDLLAEDSTPTVYDAHGLIVDMVNRKMFSEVYQYWGLECKSIFTKINSDGYKNSRVEVNWSDVSRISSTGRTIYGNLTWTYFATATNDHDNPPKQVSELNLDLVDSGQGHRLGKAMELLKESCAKKSKFD